MKFVRFLTNFYGAQKRRVKVNTGCHGIKCVSHGKREVWGLGIFIYISKTMFTKLWWIFRTTKSLWVDFKWNKYCQKLIRSVVQWKGGSQVWKKMFKANDVIKAEIYWEPTMGSFNILFDN